MVVGFATADHMRTSLVQDALQMALVRRRPAAGVIFHSDRGAQYTSRDFRSFCTKNGVRPSVGATGSCFDNAVAESFFATIKKELIHLRSWDNLTTVKTAVFDYIERYYNRRRRHSTLNYLTPAEYNASLTRKCDWPHNRYSIKAGTLHLAPLHVVEPAAGDARCCVPLSSMLPN